MKNSKKIIDLKNIPTNLMNKKIVLAHGVFDIFHLGHKKHLEIAKSNGDILVVSITSDRYVKKDPVAQFLMKITEQNFYQQLILLFL